MSFFKSLRTAVTDLTKRVISGAPPFEVQELSVQTVDRMSTSLLVNEGIIALYKDKDNFIAVVYSPSLSPKAFSLFRVTDEADANRYLTMMSFKIQALCQCPEFLAIDKLQSFSDTIRAHPGWGCAHIAAKLNLTKCFSLNVISSCINDVDDEMGILPIHIAIETDNYDCVKELIVRGAKVNLADKDGRNVFHYAARGNDQRIIQMLGAKDASIINQLNAFGESALHEACLYDKPDNVEQLLRWKVDPNLSMSHRYPIHCAIEAKSTKCLAVLHRWSRDQIHLTDKTYGGTPLHWAKTKDCIYALCDAGSNLEIKNFNGETALLAKIRENVYECVLALLVKGADAATRDARDNSALHLAIELDQPELVQLLIVFGADVNICNNSQISPRHKAAGSLGCHKDRMLYYLHAVGARRCEASKRDCTAGCQANGKFDGKLPVAPVLSPDETQKLFDGVASEVALKAALSRSASVTGSFRGSDVTDFSVGNAGERVLSLDGGGIRGLILIQLLLAIEDVTKQPIRSCFDWIAGTSTGGILALAIVHGKSVRYCQGLYFQLKDQVFSGKRPYASEPLEEFLKKEFGETTRMTEKQYPRVFVTGVLADRLPAELHLFRNYDVPGVEHNPLPSKDNKFPPVPRPNDQLVWRAARSSGAAPTYFRACGRFLDGGLMANNPTLDLLTEIHHYRMAHRAAGQTVDRPIHVVVSLGTGRLPMRSVNAVDVYRPEGLFDVATVFFGAKNLGELLIDQATQSEGRAVDRGKAWCQMIDVPYYRLSPQLSEDVGLDNSDDRTLVNMLWETQRYIHQHHEKLVQLATLLLP